MGRPNVNWNVGIAAEKQSTYTSKAVKAGIPFASQVTEPNTKYIIKYDFDLGEEEVTIPEDCILEFDGGSISNGIVIGDGTGIIWDGINAIFGNGLMISEEGTWLCPVISTRMFLNLNYVNSLRNLQYMNTDDMETTMYIEDAEYEYPVLMPNLYDYGIKMHSNTTLVLNGTIKAGDSSKAYQIIDIKSVENITICGSGQVLGDWDDNDSPTHTGTGGEWGMCISMGDAKNIYIKDITLKHAWGDGIDIGASQQCYGVCIENVTITHCGRQGMSVDGLENFAIRNCNISDITRTAPGACIDFEPNTSSGYNTCVKNGTLENNIFNNHRGVEIATRGSEGAVDNITIKGNYMNGHYRGIGIDPYARNIKILNNYIYAETNTPDDDNVSNTRLVYDDAAILMIAVDRAPQKVYGTALVELSGNTIYGTCKIYCNNAIISNNKFKNTTTTIYTDIVLTPDGQHLMRVEEELSSPVIVLGRMVMRGNNNTFTDNEVEGYVSVPVGSDNIYSNNRVAQYMEFPAAPSGCPSGLRNKLVGNIINGSFTIDANRANFEIIGNTINSSERFFVNGNECLFEGNTALNATCASAGRGNSFVGNRLKHLQLAGIDQSATSNVVGSMQGSGIIRNNIIRCTDISRFGSGSIFEGNQIFYSTPVENMTCLIEGTTAGDKPVIIRNNYFHIADSITENVPVIVNRSSSFGATDMLFDGNRLNRPSIGVSAHGSATGKFIVSNMGGESGLYADAPTVNAVWKGYRYFPIDIGYPIWWSGTTWVDATGNEIDTETT